MAGAGVRIDVELDDADVRRAFGRLLALGAEPGRALFDEIGQRLATSTADRFEREAGPDGAPWTPSERARREGGRTLSDSARLRNSITHRAAADRAEVGTNVVYAAIHQFGGEIKPKKGGFLKFEVDGRDVFARSATLPARPFLGLGADDRAMILDVVRRRIREAAA